MDSFGDHALVCACNGDRTIRHNCLRNVVYEEAVAGGMSPTKEKAGLLPSRPPQDGIHTETTRSNRARRRPADVYLPRGPGNKPAALDFACTSGLRFDRLRAAIDEPDGVCADYEDMKRNFRPDNEDRGTEELCEQQGFQFLPMVIESHSGGWGKTARRALDFISQRISAASNEKSETCSLALAQRLSCALHRENARAILRRLQCPSAADPPEVVVR